MLRNKEQTEFHTLINSVTLTETEVDQVAYITAPDVNYVE